MVGHRVLESIWHGLEAWALLVLVCSLLPTIVAVLPELWIEARRLVVAVEEWGLETVLEVAGAVSEGATYLTAVVLRLERQILGRPLLRTVRLLVILCHW